MIIHLGFKFLLMFLAAASSFFLCVKSQTDPNDAAVMFALQKALNPSPELGWTGQDPCKWNHVVCSEGTRVTRIQVGHHNLQVEEEAYEEIEEEAPKDETEIQVDGFGG